MVAFGALRGRQDMRTPFRIAVSVNVTLDALLIFGAGPVPPLGVAGAAWATSTPRAGCSKASWTRQATPSEPSYGR
jgi:Na+-driven multidrug efflux pump